MRSWGEGNANESIISLGFSLQAAIVILASQKTRVCMGGLFVPGILVSDFSSSPIRIHLHDYDLYHSPQAQGVPPASKHNTYVDEAKPKELEKGCSMASVIK